MPDEKALFKLLLARRDRPPDKIKELALKSSGSKGWETVRMYERLFRSNAHSQHCGVYLDLTRSCTTDCVHEVKPGKAVAQRLAKRSSQHARGETEVFRLLCLPTTSVEATDLEDSLKRAFRNLRSKTATGHEWLSVGLVLDDHGDVDVEPLMQWLRLIADRPENRNDGESGPPPNKKAKSKHKSEMEKGLCLMIAVIDNANNPTITRRRTIDTVSLCLANDIWCDRDDAEGRKEHIATMTNLRALVGYVKFGAEASMAESAVVLLDRRAETDNGPFASFWWEFKDDVHTYTEENRFTVPKKFRKPIFDHFRAVMVELKLGSVPDPDIDWNDDSPHGKAVNKKARERYKRFQKDYLFCGVVIQSYPQVKDLWSNAPEELRGEFRWEHTFGGGNGVAIRDAIARALPRVQQ